MIRSVFLTPLSTDIILKCNKTIQLAPLQPLDIIQHMSGLGEPTLWGRSFGYGPTSSESGESRRASIWDRHRAARMGPNLRRTVKG